MGAQPSDVGYPCTINRDFAPEGQYAQYASICIAVENGDQGKVLQASNGWHKVWIPRRNIQGSVPDWCVTVHKNRKFGDLLVQHDLPIITSSNVDYGNLDLQPKNIAEKAILGLLTAMNNQQQSLTFMNEGILAILNHDGKRQSFARDFITKLNPNYVNLLNDPQSTIQDFRKNLKPVGASDHRTGHYIRLTSNFKNQPNRKPEAYTGHTGNSFSHRKHSHKRDAAAPDASGFADLSGRDAENMELYPVGQMSCDDINRLLLAEQVNLLINGTYVDELYARNADQSKIVGADSEDFVREVVKKISKRETATILILLADAVFNEINFIPLTKRTAFGVGSGLNYSSPVAERCNYEKTLWTKVVQPGVKETYHREGLEIGHIASNAYRTHFMRIRQFHPQGGETTVDIYFDRRQKCPPTGTVVYPVWEIQLNGPHPLPWARLPDIGATRDWYLINRLALKLEYKDPVDGKWYRTYQQSDQWTRFDHDTERACVHNYNVALAVIRFLQQREADKPRGWMYTAGIARVKELKFDHPTQTVSLMEVRADPRRWSSQLKSENEVMQEMIAAGCVNVNGTWGVRGFRGAPRTLSRGEQSRENSVKKCDGCYIISTFDGLERHGRAVGIMCERMHHKDGTPGNQCKTCYFRGIFCSWTKRVDINQSMLKALNFKKQEPQVFEEIHPKILYIGREEVEEEPEDGPEDQQREQQ